MVSFLTTRLLWPVALFLLGTTHDDALAQAAPSILPNLIAYGRLKVEHPVFLQALGAFYEDGKPPLEVQPILNALAKFRGY